MKKTLIAITTLLLSTIATADELADCRAIKEATSRLACYDKLADKKAVFDELMATITEVEKTPHNKLLLTLDNNQTWRQLDSARLPLRSGDTIVIRSAQFGSYLLEKEAGSRQIRVKRVD